MKINVTCGIGLIGTLAAFATTGIGKEVTSPASDAAGEALAHYRSADTMSTVERKSLCTIAPIALKIIGEDSVKSDIDRHKMLYLNGSVEWISLNSTIKCNNNIVMLNNKNQSIDQFGISNDRKTYFVTGFSGFGGIGGSGMCRFQIVMDKPKVLGCIRTSTF